METFHVFAGGAHMQALRLMPPRSINLLISGWSYHDSKNAMRKHRHVIREAANLITFDSGFLGAARQGRFDWADQQELVLEYAEELGADRVAMMDIPMEPHILRAAGLVTAAGAPDFERALELTYRNAQRFMAARTGIAKGFVNQGWTLEQRAACHRAMCDMGVPAVAGWWGIGSVCMRRPPDLYEHADWCRKHITGHLHCFGITQPLWARQLKALGIDSHDSAKAAAATTYGVLIINGRAREMGKRSGVGESVRRSAIINALWFWLNVESINNEVNRTVPVAGWAPGPQQRRFDLDEIDETLDP